MTFEDVAQRRRMRGKAVDDGDGKATALTYTHTHTLKIVMRSSIGRARTDEVTNRQTVVDVYKYIQT